MNKNPFPYTVFDRFCLRSPLLELHNYTNLTGGISIAETALRTIGNDPVFREALFLASPVVSAELEKWEGDRLDPKKAARLRLTILKYLARITSRCTPFGLFAGCSVGEFSTQTSLILEPYGTFRRVTRFDMNFVAGLAQHITQQPGVSGQLLYYPNSSLYPIGNALRYVEYTYAAGQRKHSLEAVTNSEYLQKIFEFAKHGQPVAAIAAQLCEADIDQAEAEEFITELIANQLLVSELEPHLTGIDYSESLIDSIQTIEGLGTLPTVLQKALDEMKQLDETIGNDPQDYQNISDTLKQLEVPFEPGYLFQTDLFLNTKHATLDRSYRVQLESVFRLFAKLTYAEGMTPLDQFTKAFQQRYEHREMPLATVLDVELGIGYPVGNTHDSAPYIEDLMMGKGTEAAQNLPWTAVSRILHSKVMQAREKGELHIELTADDFEDLPENSHDLPDTVAAMSELVTLDGTDTLVLQYISGSSAVNLLGRFCHGDSGLEALAREITALESRMNPGKILAEIIHLPESRTGNVLKRPNFRSHEIPYLGKASVAVENQITLDDLTLSLSDTGKLVLKSKKNTAEVLPRLGNAHNYSRNALPVYHFLADLQNQGSRASIGFSWGAVAALYDVLPRVTFENMILSKAQWRIKKESIQHLMQEYETPQLITVVRNWRTTLQLPQWVQLADHDNTLLLNLENTDCIQMWLSTIKNRESFLLEEFLGHSTPLTGSGGSYVNQMIFSFYNHEKLNPITTSR